MGRIFILLLPLLTEDEDETETAKGETNAVDKKKFAATSPLSHPREFGKANTFGMRALFLR